ncbi:MAG: HD-GYP domain-containing protein [Dissulfurispiraceae bacterium]
MVENQAEDSKSNVTEYPVTIDQLQPGVFIRLTGVRWFDHPFLMNSFKISDKGQIKILRQLGVESVVFVPGKSDVFPLPLVKDASPTPRIEIKNLEAEELLSEKRKRIEQQRVLRQKIKACEKRFTASVETVKNVMRDIEGGRLESVHEADILLTNLIEDLMVEKDATVQLMSSDAAGGESVFYHSLNVSVLALMIGREHGLNPADLRILGLGALFHDVGKHRVPKNVLFKSTPRNKFETDIFRLHPQYGVETMQPLVESGDFPSAAIEVVRDHHERIDGSGYPSGRKILSDITKIVSIVDRYDTLCNNQIIEKSVTPHEALAFMFSKEKGEFDEILLQRFIAYLGVYPPGTIVKLNNEVTGMVISVNAMNSLRPSLLIYDPEVPKNEALIFDLSCEAASTLFITSTVRPSQLPREIYDYLNPRTRVSYFLSAEDRKQTGVSSETSSGRTISTK